MLVPNYFYAPNTTERKSTGLLAVADNRVDATIDIMMSMDATGTPVGNGLLGIKWSRDR